MKKLTSILTVLLLALAFAESSRAADGDLYVQVSNGNSDSEEEECSILKVEPDGTLSQFISPAQIEAVTESDNNECENTGLAINMAGSVFFGLDRNDNIIFDPFFQATSSSRILMATPDGTLSLFVTSAEISAVTGNSQVDLENGMEFGPDGALYVNESESNSILRITPDGTITRLITEDDVRALLPPGAVIDLDSGIAVDQFGNIYFANDDGGGGPDVFNMNNVIFKYSPASGLSILTTQQQIVNATGETQIDLDIGMVLKGVLYVMEDDKCDCILVVNPINGQVMEFISEDDITDATGEDGADLEGGIAADNNRNLFVGDDFDGISRILKVRNAKVSKFISHTELTDFYDSLDIDFFPELRASMAVEGVKARVAEIPTLSEWGLIAMATALGIIGLVVMRKRAVKA